MLVKTIIYRELIHLSGYWKLETRHRSVRRRALEAPAQHMDGNTDAVLREL